VILSYPGNFRDGVRSLVTTELVVGPGALTPTFHPLWKNPWNYTKYGGSHMAIQLKIEVLSG